MCLSASSAIQDVGFVVVTLVGAIQVEEVPAMRAETTAIGDRTGIPNRLVDLPAVEELAFDSGAIAFRGTCARR